MAPAKGTNGPDRIVRPAVEDELTGLGNKRAVMLALYGLDQPGHDYAIAHIDLDRFAEINARHGHAAGDEVIRAVARNVEQALPAEAELFRTDGDEFVIVLPGTADREEVATVAEVVDTAIREPIDLRDGTCVVTASMGWAMTPTPSPRWALAQADAALAAAKRAGGGRIHTHSPFDPLW